MQLELALTCTGTSNCKWHSAIGTAQEMLLSGQERLRQCLRSQAVAQHDISQLGGLKAPPGSSAGDLEHMPPVRMLLECTCPFLARKLQAYKEPQGRWSSSPKRKQPQHCTAHSPAEAVLPSWRVPKKGRINRKSPAQGEHADIVCTRGSSFVSHSSEVTGGQFCFKVLMPIVFSSVPVNQIQSTVLLRGCNCMTTCFLDIYFLDNYWLFYYSVLSTFLAVN